MMDPDTFLTILYGTAEDFCKYPLPPAKTSGPRASLARSEVVTLALFGQWSRFSSERGFYRYASRRLSPAFPTLPDRGQFNRWLRRHYGIMVAFFRHLVALIRAQETPYEALDRTGVPTRDAKRRGTGWPLAGQADMGWSNHLGWYEGFPLLRSVNPQGAITGFSFAPASTSDQALAEDFFALRGFPHPRIAPVGGPAWGYYVVDKGFAGKDRHWYCHYGASVGCPPKGNSPSPGRSSCVAGWRACGSLSRRWARSSISG